MDLKLKSKKVFISGSTQGIGFAIARQLLREGAEVILNGRDTVRLFQAVEKLQKEFPHGSVTGLTADFSIREQVDVLLTCLNDIDILINNVGQFGLREFYQITEDQWMEFFEINVMSGIRLSRSLLPGMLERNWGRILFIGSESGVNVPAEMIHYGMTKAAMMAVSNGLSKLTKGTEVTVNTILGGPTYSEGVAAAIEHNAKVQNLPVEQMKNSVIQQTIPDSLVQRFLEPCEIASLVTFLASPVSTAINGASLRADGGVLKMV